MQNRNINSVKPSAPPASMNQGNTSSFICNQLAQNTSPQYIGYGVMMDNNLEC
jgi:hypothetical protein